MSLKTGRSMQAKADAIPVHEAQRLRDTGIGWREIGERLATVSNRSVPYRASAVQSAVISARERAQKEKG